MRGCEESAEIELAVDRLHWTVHTRAQRIRQRGVDGPVLIVRQHPGDLLSGAEGRKRDIATINVALL
jgi:hypothetical protein